MDKQSIFHWEFTDVGEGDPQMKKRLCVADSAGLQIDFKRKYLEFVSMHFIK